jgi:hypothetical protein
MPVRMIHKTAQAVQQRASRSWGRMMSSALTKDPSGGPSKKFPIPLALPCEIMLGIFEMLPPESAVSLVFCCWYMRGLYCEEGTFPADQLWAQLLRRTFPVRLTGAPGPNAPPRLRRSNQLTLSALSGDWVDYARELRQAPRVTGVQIAKFVRWAASAHSWYKHLPLQDAAVFSFVLDLTVGMRRTPEGFVDQHEGDARTHYSWLPTRAYREAFGLLTYRDALPAFQPNAASGPRSVSIQTADARRVWVPSHLVEVGSCRITAACHGRSEAYQIYHHAYDAFCQARIAGTLPKPPPPPATDESFTVSSVDVPAPSPFSARAPNASGGGGGNRASSEEGSLTAVSHSYSYLNKQAQRESVRSLPPEVLRDFELLHVFEMSGQDHAAEAQCALIQKLFPSLSAKQVSKLQDRKVWGSPWQPGGAYLGAPDVVVTAEKAREWQRMFDHARAFCEKVYGEKVNMEGVRPCTMTCLALETLPLPVYDLMAM